MPGRVAASAMQLVPCSVCHAVCRQKLLCINISYTPQIYCGIYHLYIHTHICTYTHTSVHTHTHLYIHTHICTCTHTRYILCYVSSVHAHSLNMHCAMYHMYTRLQCVSVNEVTYVFSASECTRTLTRLRVYMM